MYGVGFVLWRSLRGSSSATFYCDLSLLGRGAQATGQAMICDASACRQALEVLSSLSLWTLLLEALSMVWFFAVVNMEFSGLEIVLLLPPLCIYLFFSRPLFARPEVLRRLQEFLFLVGVLLGHGSRFLDSPMAKLLCCSLGLTAILLERLASIFFCARREERASSVELTVSSLVLLLVLRRLSGSMNPLFVFRGPCAGFIAVSAVVAAWHLLLQPDVSLDGQSATSFAGPSQLLLSSSTTSLSPMRAGLALGGCFYLLLFFCTEASLHVRSAGLHQLDLFACALTLGLCFGSLLEWPSLTMMNRRWLVWSCIVPSLAWHWLPDASVATLLCSTMIAFFALRSVAGVVERVVAIVHRRHLPLVLSTAFLFVFVLCTVHVYASVYKFVPGGALLRERPWVSVVLASLSLGGLLWTHPVGIDWHFYQVPCIPLSFPAFGSRVAQQVRGSKGLIFSLLTNPAHPTPRCLHFVALLLAVGCAMFHAAYPARLFAAVLPHASGLNVATAAVWNIRWAMDDGGQYSYDAIEAMLGSAALNVEIVALIETDQMHVHSAHRDTTEYLSKRLGLPYSLYGPSTRRSSFGINLLSRFPVVEAEEFTLPSPQGEVAPAIDALLDIRGRRTRVMAAHFGNTEDTLDLVLQSKEMADRARRYGDSGFPVLFLFYITSRMDGGVPYETLTHAGGLLDSAPLDSNRYCQYILYRNAHIISYVDVKTAPISDTELLAAQFVLDEDSGRTVSSSLERLLTEMQGAASRLYSAFDHVQLPFGQRGSLWAYDVDSQRTVRTFVRPDDS